VSSAISLPLFHDDDALSEWAASAVFLVFAVRADHHTSLVHRLAMPRSIFFVGSSPKRHMEHSSSDITKATDPSPGRGSSGPAPGRTELG